MATTEVVNVARQNRGPGTITFDVAQPVPANIRFATLEILLDTPDKLAVGNWLDIQSFFSPNGFDLYAFANGTHWVSYGPDGLVVTDPDGTVRVNPNPRIQVPLIDRQGQFLRCSTNLGERLNAGALVTITT